MISQANNTPVHILDDKIILRSLTPTKYKKCQKISDDSCDPIQDILNDQESFARDTIQMREKANAIAKLSGKKSTNCQTIQRTYQRHIDTQVYLPCELACNTQIDNNTNAATPNMNFVRTTMGYKLQNTKTFWLT